MRKVYCYAEKEEKPEEIDHSEDIVQDLSSLDISDLKNRSFFFIGGEIIENPYYEPSEYMKRVYAAIDAQYEKFYRSDKDKKDSEEKDDVKDAEEETNKQSSDDEMPDWIAEMPYGELIKRFPGGISEALEYAKKEKGLSVPEVHYDSPEPEKLGVKAFTKNAEVYLAPGEGEETLKHELGHVIQQKKEKIPATTEIDGEKVNLNPALEKEADKLSENLNNAEKLDKETVQTQDVIQFAKPTREELERQLEDEATRLDIRDLLSDATKTKILDKAEQHTPGWVIGRGTALDNVIKPALQKIKNISEIAIAKNDSDWITSKCVDAILQKIDSSISKSWFGELLWFESDIKKIIDEELSQIKLIIETAPNPIFMSTDRVLAQVDKTLRDAITEILDADQSERVKKCFSALKNLCDDEGVRSVLKGANENTSPYVGMLDFNALESEKIPLAEYFVKRLEQMRAYIEGVSQKRDSDGRTFGEKYWMRSTGSDPHKGGEHALFFVNKENQKGHEEDPRKKAREIACVYKAHDLKSDAAVVGKSGMFQKTNELIKTEFEQKSAELGLNLKRKLDALATMAITTDVHTEELVIKKGEMDPDEAKLYFFRGGILKALTDAMAVIDLYGDNIMPTGNGPMIIDAEINFFHYGKDSSLVKAFKTKLIGDRPPVSLFTIARGGFDGKDISC